MKQAELIIKKKGQSLLELMIAMGLFALMGSIVTWLVIDVYSADRAGRERTQATYLAQEGIEAVRSMRDLDFDNLNPGTYGLALSGNRWVFSGASDVHDQFTRRIVVSNIAGTINQTDTKKIESQVVWKVNSLRQASVNLTDYLTDWKQTQGSAQYLKVNIDSAALASSNRRLRGITIQNTGSSSITIDKMTLWWSNANLIEEVRIVNAIVWRYTGTGTPTGRQSSGTELNINNYTLPRNSSSREITRIDFSGSMSGATFIILFKMSDNSTRYVLVKP